MVEIIHHVAGAGEAEAIQQALLAAGIEAQVLLADQGDGGGLTLSIAVPDADAERAREIIRQGDWPRWA